MIPRWTGTLKGNWSDWPVAACSTVVPRKACANHHITTRRYLELLHAQDGVCAICGYSNYRMGEIVPLHIDHDHVCCDRKHSCGRCVRGLHCSPCGTLVGYLEYNGGPELYPTDERTAQAMQYLAERGIDPADPVRLRRLLEGYKDQFVASQLPPDQAWLDRLHELRSDSP